MTDMDISSTIFSIPARVLLPDAQRAIDLMTMIKDRHVLDPKILEERQLFTWDAEISSDVVDSHFTHMLPNTLANFRDDALAGVAFLLGHNHSDLPSGRSFNAELSTASNPARTRVVASFYTLLGMTINGVKTDDIVDGLRSGLTKDNSVGFFGGNHLCDIDGMDYWSWDCPHIPGKRYEITKNGVAQMVVSTFSVDNARLAEVSGVFAGSTPNAEVLKAQREAEIGRIDPDVARAIEQRYRIKLPAANRAFAGVEIPKGQTPKEEKRMEKEQVGQLTSTLIRAGVLTEEQRETATDADLLAAADKLAKRAAELEPQATDGRQYRSDLVTEALAEGVRAQGKDFDKPTYEAMLTNAPITTIKRMRDDWKKIGDERFSGGRKSVDDDQTPAKKEAEPVRVVPAGAYAA